MLLSFLLFISVTDCKQYNTTFSLSLQTRQQVSFHRLYGTILCTGCIVPFGIFYLLVEHVVRRIGNTILQLKSQYYILKLFQLLWEMVLVFLFLGIQLCAV